MADQERRLTLKSRKLARAIVLDGAETVTEAAKMAGMVRQSASRALQNATVQREIAHLEEQQSDKARSIRKLSARRLRERLDDPNASDPLVLGAYKVAHEVDDGDGDQVDPGDQLAYSRKIAQAVRVGAYLERRKLRNA